MNNDKVLACKSVESAMKSEDARAEFNTRNENSFEVRYWGNWENPAHAEGEEDYDWQDLTQESAAKLKSIIEQAQATYPGVQVRFHVEEKNWIIVEVEARA